MLALDLSPTALEALQEREHGEARLPAAHEAA